ncbi:MAG: hypothetical protein R3C10_24525 [Pirellulales bacterium]
MPKSVLDAIKMGVWDFEPEDTPQHHYESTRALPGTMEKIRTLEERLSNGLPLWHEADRLYYEDSAE